MVNSIRKSLLAHLDTNRRADLIWRSRVRHLIASKEAVTIAAGPQIFLHLIPLSEEPFSIDRHNPQLYDAVRSVPLLFGHYPHNYRINIDGYFGYAASSSAKKGIISYFQLFWDGSVEFCDTTLLEARQIDGNEKPKIHLPYFEAHLIKGLKPALKFLKDAQEPLPVRLYLAIIGARGYVTIAARQHWPEDHSIDRDELYFDPVTLDDWEVNLDVRLRPLFDQLWNAGNFTCSNSYDQNGEWKPRLD